MSDAALIAVDWGTTSARVYKVDADGDVRDERSASLGISQIDNGRFDEAFAKLLGDWRSDPAPRLACGMIGSRQGWTEAPYVRCPASLEALASGLAMVRDARLSIVPGLMTRDRFGIPDVMRGEETQLVGASEASAASFLAVLPGTHSKWARIERGAITDFTTYMTGELYAVLLSHSILGRTRNRRAADDVGAEFLRGVDRGLQDAAVTHAIFGARTRVLAKEMEATDVDDWLSGVLIGAEIRAAREWARDAGVDGTRVRIIGADALVARYDAALRRADLATEGSDRHAAARGLWRIAQEAGLVR